MSGDIPQSETQAPKRQPFFEHHMWWILVLGLCGLATYPIFKYEAFPTASLDLKKPRLEIQADAEKLAPQLGFKKDNLIESTVFDYDDDEKTFLEHEYPQDQANKLMSSAVPVWYWKSRFCKEFDQEEFSSWLSPDGKLVSFAHEIPNDRELKSVSHEAAKEIALGFLKQKEPEFEKFSKLVSDEAFTKPKREDHSFTWEDPNTEFKGGHLRIYCYVSGDQVTDYTKYLHVPDSWRRKFETMRSYNDLLGTFAFFFINLLKTLGFLIFVWGIITRNVRWRPAIFGAVVLGGIASLDYLNHLPVLISRYSPVTSYNDYIIKKVIEALLGFFATALSGLALFGGAEIVYRWLFPKKIALEKLITRVGMTQFSVVKGVLVGHLLVGIHLGWIVLYYIFGKNLHYWCPLGVENYAVLSNLVPFVAAVALGIQASFEEELACRVIGIGLGMKLFRGNFWLANLFQSVVWGFAHSSYPQEPAYARGVELTIVGLLQGWILERFGLIAVITEHYLLDAFMDVESFLYADDPLLKLSVIPALLPVALLTGVAIALTRPKRLEDNEDLFNDKIPFVKPEAPVIEEPVIHADYKPLSKAHRVTLILICALGIFSTIMVPWSYGINKDAKLSLDRDRAIVLARDVMKKHHVDPADWMNSASCWVDDVGESFQYMFEKSNAPACKKIYQETRRGFYWKVRFFRPLHSEEYEVYIDSQGREISFDITREEDDPGASLSEEEARKLADQYLMETHPEYTGFKLTQVSSQKRKNRIDYTAKYTYPPLKVGEANCKLSVDVIGHQVGNFRQWWDVPDSWKFERRKKTTKDEVLSHLRTATAVIGILLFLWWCFTLLRTGAVRWRVPLLLAVLGVLLLVVRTAIAWPTFFNDYTTTTPLNSYVMQRIVGTAESMFGAAAGTLLLAAIVFGALKILAPRTPIASYLNLAIGKGQYEDPKMRRQEMLDLWLDAVLFAAAGICFTLFVDRVSGMVSYAVSPSVPEASMSYVTALADSGVPILYVFISAFMGIASLIGFLVVAMGMKAKFAPGFWRFCIFGLVAIAIVNSASRYWQDYLIQVGASFVMFLSAIVGVALFARNNYAAYLVFLLSTLTLAYASALLVNGTTLFLPEMVVLFIANAVPLILVLGLWLRNRFL